MTEIPYSDERRKALLSHIRRLTEEGRPAQQLLGFEHGWEGREVANPLDVKPPKGHRLHAQWQAYVDGYREGLSAARLWTGTYILLPGEVTPIDLDDFNVIYIAVTLAEPDLVRVGACLDRMRNRLTQMNLSRSGESRWRCVHLSRFHRRPATEAEHLVHRDLYLFRVERQLFRCTAAQAYCAVARVRETLGEPIG